MALPSIPAIQLMPMKGALLSTQPTPTFPETLPDYKMPDNGNSTTNKSHAGNVDELKNSFFAKFYLLGGFS